MHFIFTPPFVITNKLVCLTYAYIIYHISALIIIVYHIKEPISVILEGSVAKWESYLKFK